MKRERLLNVLLLLVVIGLAVQLIYTENKPPVHTVTTVVSPVVVMRSITNTVTGTVTMNVTKSTTLGVLAYLRQHYPGAFQNSKYDLFVSVDVDTLPKWDGGWTYKNVSLTYEFSGYWFTIHSSYSLNTCRSDVLVIATADVPDSQWINLTSYARPWDYLNSCEDSYSLYLNPPGQPVHYHLYLFYVTPSS